MAAKGLIDQLLNTLPADERRVLVQAFQYVMSYASLGGETKAQNFNWFKVTGTTSSNANTEFSIVHGLDHAPTYLVPVMDLTQIGSQLVPLTVSQAPDEKRVYLKSSSTGATFVAYLE